MNKVGVALMFSLSPSAIEALIAVSDCALMQACKLGHIRAVLLAEIHRDLVQLVNGVLHVLLVAADLALVGVQIVRQLPVCRTALRGQAVRIDGRVLAPRDEFVPAGNPCRRS